MGREQRRRHNQKRQISLKNKYIIYWLSILGVVAAILIIYVINSDNNKEETKQGNISNLIISDATDELTDDTENVSSSIGNTVEESQKEQEIQNNTETTTETATNNNTSSPIKSNSSEKNETNSNSSAVKTENTTKNETNEVEEKEEENKNTETANTEVVKKEITFVEPVSGTVIKEFAKDTLVYSETLKEWITHNGIDIAAEKTTVVKSVASGTVKAIKNDPRYGLTVIISHDDGFETVYSNLLTAEFIVEGESLEAGQSIGTVGSSAVFESSDEPHLHFEMLKDGEYIDPRIYIK